MTIKTVTAVLSGPLLAALTLAGAGCVPPDITTGGPARTSEDDVAEIVAVQVSSSPIFPQVYHRFEVEIVPSDTYSVSVTANDHLFSYIHVSRSGSTLHIQLRDVQVSFSPATIQARIATPRLSQLSASGAAVVTAHGFKSADGFKLEISGGARADLDIETGDFAATIKGGNTGGHEKVAN